MNNNIFKIFVERSPFIIERAVNFLELKHDELTSVNRWGQDYFERIIPFMKGGKCIRGNLVLLGAEIAGTKINPALLDVAAAMEIFQASILIHDDIIDQDEQRRGNLTVHNQYTNLSKAELKTSNNEHVGVSLALCTGDVGFNLTYALMAEADLPAESIVALTKFWGIEFAKVGLAEMDDVFLAFTDEAADLERIIALYRYKTARYTFCTPLLSGLIAAQADHIIISQIERLGDILGIIFQIKDDELGLFGDAKALGKPVGSDIRENKKTIFHHYLMNLDDQAITQEMQAIFGNKSVSEADITKIQKTILEHGIKDLVDLQIDKLVQKANTIIESINIKPEFSSYLEQLLQYNLNRKF